jgi:ABC-type transport system involved in cytochrome bd biosynthesis fused ATPase/permease subunit
MMRPSKMNIAIAVSTAVALVYVIVSRLDVSFAITFGLLLLSQVLLLNMVYRILKHPTQSKYTFDERFYDDADLGPGK